MKKKLWVCGLFGLLALGLLVGCNEEESSQKTDGDQEENETQPDGDNLDGDEPDGDQEQAEELGCRHCSCLGDGTCNVGLHCESNLCEADQEVTWVRIPGGTFWMGCGGEGTCTPSSWAVEAKPRHQVTVPAFEITQTEVTNLQYNDVMEVVPSGDRFDNAPAPASWEHAKACCEALGGRLPTEAEWEYAARAGTETDYYCGNDMDCLQRITWYCSGEPDFCSVSVNIVGGKEPNAFGLYDMIGNVGELCEDTFQGNYEGAPTDGSAWVVEPAEGFNAIHVVRGGFERDYNNGGSVSVFKVWLRWDGWSGSFPIGFRCVRDIQEEGEN